MSSLHLWVSMLTTVWAPVSCEMMEGLNFMLLANICLLVWTEHKLFVMFPWTEPLLHPVVLQCKDHSQPPHYLSSLLQWRGLTFLRPLFSLTSFLKQNRKKKKKKRHLAKRILYLFKRERWEFGSGHIKSFSVVFSLKLMVLGRAFFAFFKTPVSRDIFTWQSQHLVKIFLVFHPAAAKSEKGSGCFFGSPEK